jgi:2-oxoglutarate ferredoxin oxidoreductase subunit gamma
VPVNDIAVRLGSVLTANIVALAAFVSCSRIVGIDTLKRCIKDEFAKKRGMVTLNLAAIEEGIKAVAK